MQSDADCVRGCLHHVGVLVLMRPFECRGFGSQRSGNVGGSAVATCRASTKPQWRRTLTWSACPQDAEPLLGLLLGGA